MPGNYSREPPVRAPGRGKDGARVPGAMAASPSTTRARRALTTGATAVVSTWPAKCVRRPARDVGAFAAVAGPGRPGAAGGLPGTTGGSRDSVQLAAGRRAPHLPAVRRALCHARSWVMGERMLARARADHARCLSRGGRPRAARTGGPGEWAAVRQLAPLGWVKQCARILGKVSYEGAGWRARPAHADERVIRRVDAGHSPASRSRSAAV
jgi:hypothetical protein